MKSFRRNGCWLSVFCIGLIIFSGCSGQLNQINQPQQTNLQAQPEQSQQPSPQKVGWAKSFQTDFFNWPPRIIDDSCDVLFKGDNLTGLLLAGGASITLHNSGADKKLDKSFTSHRVFNGFFDETLDVIGNPGTHFAATGLWYALSVESGDELNKGRAWTMMTAMAITGLTTVALKAIRNNHTPNGKAFAWPSGHTSSSVTVAAVLDELYGPKVGIPAYIAAGLVAYRMMDTGDHWASDVVFGATLGWVVGHTVAGKHKKLELAGFEIIPYTGINATGSTTGVSLVKEF